MTSTFYPPITDLVNPDDISEKLGFLKTGINTILSKLYYKKYTQDIDLDGSQGIIGITIIPYIPMDLPIIGTEIKLILNPGSTFGTSEFPISISYNWEIMKYLSTFNISNFSGNPKDLFELILEIFILNEADLLESTILRFIQTNNNDKSMFKNI